MKVFYYTKGANSPHFRTKMNIVISLCCVAEPIIDVGGCSDGSASSLGRSPFAKQRSFKCMGKASRKSSSSGAEGAK
jgi:hypothetical protein